MDRVISFRRDRHPLKSSAILRCPTWSDQVGDPFRRLPSTFDHSTNPRFSHHSDRPGPPREWRVAEASVAPSSLRPCEMVVVVVSPQLE